MVLSVGVASLLSTAIFFCCLANAQSGRDISPDDPSSSGQRDELPKQGRLARPEPLLQLFDVNGDDRLSFTEVDAIADKLKQGDEDNDGYLVREELPQPPRPEETSLDQNMRRPTQPPRDQIGRSRDPFRPAKTTAIDTSAFKQGTVVFHDGYQTDPRDGGRPVVLIAAALGVKDDVFRDAFSQVRPARGGQPTTERVKDNKSVLMAALSPHGITNKRLDEVSDYYRYRPQDGELWTHRPARAEVIVTNGQVTAVKLLDHGAGYSSAPRVEIVGYPDVKVEAILEFSTNLRANGRIQSLTFMP